MYDLKIDIEYICINIPKCINWYSQPVASFYWGNIPLNLSIGFEPCHNRMMHTVEHIIKLKGSWPWISALVLSIDFWRIKQWPTTIKAASSPVANVAYVSKPKQCTGLWYLLHWSFCIQRSKLTKLSWVTTYCSIHLAQKSLGFICHDSRFVLRWTKSCFYHFDKISDKWWLRRIWLPHIVTRAHVWMKTPYGNYIMTLLR